MPLPVHCRKIASLVIVFAGLLAACSVPVATPADPVEPATRTPFQPGPSSAIATEVLPEPTAVPPTDTPQPPLVWRSPAVPETLLLGSQIPESVIWVDRPDEATWLLETGGKDTPESPTTSRWVYALVAAFPTRLDAVSTGELQAAWGGTRPDAFAARPLLMSGETKAAIESLWGPAGEGAVEVLPAGELLDAAWQPPYGWAIVPFEELQPRWKVLRVNGQSPIDKEFIPYEYPLTVTFRLTGPAAPDGFGLAVSNRDPGKLTIVVITGTTALVRHTAARMEEKGIDYPAGDVLPWLR
ncbi:MAG TPA: hypothetical protein VFF68_05935, partial [Anaerolineaceae bacterium]|nr:hypothetical protein [Anaerolineaceae bacterium]